MCIEQWRDSFTKGDLKDRKILREALAYQNYRDSPAAIQAAADQILAGADCERALEGKGYAEESHYGLGAEIPFHGSSIFFVIDRTRLPGNPKHWASQPPEFLAEPLGKITRHAMFVSDWTDDNGEQRLSNPHMVDCADLLKYLGISRAWAAKDVLLIFALKVSKVHKPTWIDSNLGFYWYAAKDRPAWGLTRSLETGLPTLKEWVLRTRKSAYQVTQYWERTLERDYKLLADHLDDGYWQACAQEIRP